MAFGTSEPIYNYAAYVGGYKLEYGKGFQCTSTINVLVDIITAVTELRKSVQREERLEARLRMLQIAMSTGDETKELYQCDEELKAPRRTIDLQQRNLCDMESMLPRQSVKIPYD